MTAAPGLGPQPLLAAGLEHAWSPGGPPAVAVGRLAAAPGTTTALTGPSGSGKTTLAYLLTGIEPVRRGSVRWGTTELAGLPEAARDAWRRRAVGFVFQDFHLVPGLSALANVLAPTLFARWRPSPALVDRAHGLLDAVGVPALGRGRDATALSRGEQQRVALARALLHRPPVLVADEPTASLDARSGALVIDLLLRGAAETGATLLAVTHDPALVEAVAEVHHLDHGRLERAR